MKQFEKADMREREGWGATHSKRGTEVLITVQMATNGWELNEGEWGCLFGRGVISCYHEAKQV